MFLHICSSNRHHVGIFLGSGCFQTPRIQRQTSRTPALKDLGVGPRAGRCRLSPMCRRGQHGCVNVVAFGSWVLLLNKKKNFFFKRSLEKRNRKPHTKKIFPLISFSGPLVILGVLDGVGCLPHFTGRALVSAGLFPVIILHGPGG